MSCPKNEQKKYIIPTNKWLEPINQFITDDIGTEGFIY